MTACLIISSIRTINELMANCKKEESIQSKTDKKGTTLDDQLKEWDK
jgi:hypothetical protein